MKPRLAIFIQTTLASSIAMMFAPALAQQTAPTPAAAASAPGAAASAPGAAASAAAPEAAPVKPAAGATSLNSVTVTGYRASIQRAMEVKRNSNSIVDAISAEDIGKFPDRNAAESLAHLPGVSVDRLYGEGEKVSINGTDPSLNRVLVNGQTIATGDWGGAPGDQQGGRTFNYTLLAPEIIGLMEVYKSPEARIDEGSIGGTVIIHTRKPLELPANTLRGSVGYLYNDRSKDGDPRASLLYSWKNDTGTFGALAAFTHDKQRIRQASVQFFCGYTTGSGIPATATITGGGNPATARLPTCIDSSDFDQERKRDGFQGALQWKLDQQNEFNLTGIYIKGKYDNFSQSRYFVPGGGDAARITSANVSGGLVNSATIAGPAYGQLDTNYRKSDLTTKSLNLTHEFTGSDWKLKSQVGTTEATGGKNPEYLMKFLMKEGGYSFNYGNQSAGLTVDRPEPSNWRLDGPSANSRGDQAGGIYYSETNDRERYGQMDFSKDLEWGPVKEVLVGFKIVSHKNEQNARGNSLFPTGPVSLAQFAPAQVPANLFSGFNVNEGIYNWFTPTAGSIISYLQSLPGAGSFPNPDRGSTFRVQEDIKSLYTQFNYELGKFRGNFGVRYVDTKDDSLYYLTNSTPGGDIFSREERETSYRRLLPSFNLAYDIDDNKIVRASVAKVLARPRYSDLAGAINRDDQQLSGSGGNPNLKPYESTNFDLAGEWYFQPRSMLGAEFFYRQVKNYVVSITNDQQAFNPLTQQIATYSVTTPFNGAKAIVRGLSLIYQQDIAYGFGIQSNYTYTEANTSNGLNMPYLSRNSYTLTPYYESGPFSARLIYNYRTSYFTQVGKLQANQFAGAYKQLDASMSYQITKNFGLSLNAANLLDSTYYQYQSENTNAPIGFYKNGRVYTLSLNMSL